MAMNNQWSCNRSLKTLIVRVASVFCLPLTVNFLVSSSVLSQSGRAPQSPSLSGSQSGLQARSQPNLQSDVQSGSPEVVVDRIIVNRSNIFDGPVANPSSPVALAAVTINRLHTTTREEVILREIGVAPGDSLSLTDISDIERRLRALGIFSSVAARFVTANDGIELHITTRDNLSLVAGASGSFLGGVGNVGVRFGERNLLGTGNRLFLDVSRNTLSLIHI